MGMEKKHSSTGEHHHNHGHHHGPAWKRLHRDWRLWVVVGLMLAAMLVYVLSDDESLRPGGPPGKPAPAAAGS